jgi:hypothetical protein
MYVGERGGGDFPLIKVKPTKPPHHTAILKNQPTPNLADSTPKTWYRLVAKLYRARSLTALC